MKKNIFWSIMILFVCLFAGNVFADNTPLITETPTLKVIVDGTQLSLKNTPINYNSRVLLGLRELLIALGVPNDSEHIIWNQENKSIKIVKDNKEIFLSIGNKKAIVNGEEIELDIEPVLYKNSTYIPARFISQSLSRFVYWDSATYSVIITNEESFNQLSELLEKIEVQNGKPIQIKQSETLLVEGIEKYKCTYDIKTDLDKDIEHIDFFEIEDGIRTETEIYQNAQNIYIKSEFRNQWNKQPRAVNSEALSQKETDNTTQGSLAASLIIKENDYKHIILEGDNLVLVADSTSNSVFDVLKDKTSKCHIKLELKVTAVDLGIFKYEIKRIESVTTGSYETKEGIKTYSITKIVEYMLDEDIIVPVPSDLDNFYTVPEGMNEYFNSYRGYTLYVPYSWYLPDTDDEFPGIIYEDEENPDKFCGILVEFVNMNYPWTLSDIRSDLVKIAQDSLNNSKIIKNENINWNGNEAILISVAGNIKESGDSVKKQMIFSNFDQRLLIITYIGEPSTFELKYEEATQIINSWTQLVFG